MGILLKESEIKRIIKEEMDKSDVISLIKSNKDIEKKIKEITANVIAELYRSLWQQKSFWKNNIL